MSIFGAITVADQLEQAALDTLEKWFRTFLIEYELQAGMIPNNMTEPVHPLPKSYLKSNTLDRELAEAMPAIAVVSPGTSTRTRPRQEGDGSFRVFFNVGIGVFASANTRADTLKLVREYTAICRTIILQRQDLGGFADGCEWLSESYDDDFSFQDTQTISAGQVAFEFEVAGVVNRFDGPKTVDPDPSMPGSDWPLAATVMAAVEIKED